MNITTAHPLVEKLRMVSSLEELNHFLDANDTAIKRLGKDDRYAFFDELTRFVSMVIEEANDLAQRAERHLVASR